MKIGLFIQSSNQELFVKNTNIIKEYYQNILKKLNISFEVYSFIGNNYSQKTPIINGSEIILPCDDRNVALKHYELIQIIKNTLNYFDVIIKTNATTILNLLQIEEFCNNSLFNRLALYCSDGINHNYMWNKEGKYVKSEENFQFYPNGNFLLFSNEIFEIIYENYMQAYKHIDSISFDVKKESREEWLWYGVPEDQIIGYIINSNNIPILKFNNFLQIYNNNNLFPQNLYDCDNPFNMIGMSCKVHNDYNIRMYFEPSFIYFTTKLLEHGIK